MPAPAETPAPTQTAPPTTTINPATHPCGPTARWRVAATAPLAALAVWVVADPLAGVDLAVQTGDRVQQVGPVSVLLAASLAAAASVGVVTAFHRWTRHPRRTWTVLGTVLCVLSLAGPLGASSAAATAVLSGMHAVVGGVLVRGLARTLPTARPATVPPATARPSGTLGA